MRTLFILVFAFFASISLAQTYSLSEYDSMFNKVTHVFEDLDTSKIEYEYLYDRSMDLVPVQKYDGVIHDSNYINRVLYKALYGAVFSSHIPGQTNWLDSAHVMSGYWKNSRSRDTFSLSGMLVKYNIFVDSALQEGYIDTSNGKLVDKYVSGQWINPYEEKTIFTIASPVQILEQDTIFVILDSNLWYTNVESEVRVLEVDFGDGNGYQDLHLNTPIEVIYSDTGYIDWVFKLTDNSDNTYKTHTKVDRRGGSNGGVVDGKPDYPTDELPCNGAMNFGIVTNYEAESKYSLVENFPKADITIFYKDNDCIIKKPLIVVEGYDFTTFINPEIIYGTHNYNTWMNRIGQGGMNIADEIVDIPQYDIVYIDFHNHSDYLENNSILVQDVIEWVNEWKQPDGEITHENVVWGESMGGILASHALASLEDNSIDHDTRLMISYDAPLLGAHIPVGFQHTYRTAVSFFQSFNIDLDLFDLIDQPAVQQMLTYYVDEDNMYDNSVYNSWQNSLSAVGTPSNCRNVAISNGSECGTTQENLDPGDYLVFLEAESSPNFIIDLLLSVIPIPFTPGPQGGLGIGVGLGVPTTLGHLVLGLLPGKNQLSVDYKVRIPEEGNPLEVFKLKIWYTKKLFWAININFTILDASANSTSSMLPLEIYSGGYLEYGSVIEEVYESVIDAIPSYINYDIILEYEDIFGFIPTASALNISGSPSSLDGSDYSAAYSPVDPLSTFDNFITENNAEFIEPNKYHLTLMTRHGNWIVEELDNNLPTDKCEEFCDGNIEGPAYMCDETEYTVTPNAGTITWDVSPSGKVSSNSTGNVLTLTPIEDGNITITATRESSYCHNEITKVVAVQTEAEAWILGGPTITAHALPDLENATYTWILDDVTLASTSDNEYEYDCEEGTNFLLEVEISHASCTFDPAEYPYSMPSCLESLSIEPSQLDKLLNGEYANISDAKNISIYDINGRLINQMDPSLFDRTSIGRLPAGLYFIVLKFDNGNVDTKRIVKLE